MTAHNQCIFKCFIQMGLLLIITLLFYMQTVCDRILCLQFMKTLGSNDFRRTLINARNSKWPTVANLPKLKFKTKKEREKKAGL